MPPNSNHVLIYEPRTEGHHLGWLRFIVEDLLEADYRLSLAVDLRPAARGKLEDHLSGLLSRINLLPACDESGRRQADGKAGAVAFCLRESGAARVFLAAFDEIASACWRRAAFGFNPPPELRGRMGGIYHRPRFLVAPRWSPNRILKTAGFRKLLLGGWLSQLLFLDEYLLGSLRLTFPGTPLFFLPDPCPENFGGDTAAARRQLDVPLEKRVLLFFGVGQRRKGLHLAVEAMRTIAPGESPFLLCAGRQNARGHIARGLDQLVSEGRARVLDRYVSTREEELCFSAADAVLLPYVHHFGTSGVLSRAMAAGKMVIVSDEQLLGRLTREHNLGLWFSPGAVAELSARMRQAAAMATAELSRFSAAAGHYAQRYSRAAFRAGLVSALGGGYREARP